MGGGLSCTHCLDNADRCDSTQRVSRGLMQGEQRMGDMNSEALQDAGSYARGPPVQPGVVHIQSLRPNNETNVEVIMGVEPNEYNNRNNIQPTYEESAVSSDHRGEAPGTQIVLGDETSPTVGSVATQNTEEKSVTENTGNFVYSESDSQWSDAVTNWPGPTSPLVTYPRSSPPSPMSH